MSHDRLLTKMLLGAVGRAESSCAGERVARAFEQAKLAGAFPFGMQPPDEPGMPGPAVLQAPIVEEVWVWDSDQPTRRRSDSNRQGLQ